MATDVVVLHFGEPGIFTSSLVNGAVNGAAETQWPHGQIVAIEVMTDFVQQNMEAHVPPGSHAPPHQRKIRIRSRTSTARELLQLDSLTGIAVAACAAVWKS
jgi:hypothetical protein